MPKLSIVVCSTRPGRVGLHVAEWFQTRASAHGKFDAAVVDLKTVALPLFDEPHHPRFKRYEHAHTKAWSAIVEASDAFAFVLPEYNFGPPPSFVNAVDYLFQEWAYKPATFVSYGGMSGGLRAVQQAKLTLTTMKVMPIPDAVAIPFVGQHLDKETGAFTATEAHEKSVVPTLDELHRWAEALAPLRTRS